MNPKTRAEFVSRDLVAMGAIEPQSWPVIASVVADAIHQDRDSYPHDEEDRLP